MIQTASRRTMTKELTSRKYPEYSGENPVSQSLVVRIRGVIGLYLKTAAAKPLVGMGNTTGVMYMRNCINKGNDLPISV